MCVCVCELLSPHYYPSRVSNMYRISFHISFILLLRFLCVVVNPLISLWVLVFYYLSFEK